MGPTLVILNLVMPDYRTAVATAKRVEEVILRVNTADNVVVVSEVDHNMISIRTDTDHLATLVSELEKEGFLD